MILSFDIYVSIPGHKLLAIVYLFSYFMLRIKMFGGGLGGYFALSPTFTRVKVGYILFVSPVKHCC